MEIFAQNIEIILKFALSLYISWNSLMYYNYLE